jgi:hypothetical protein
MKQLKILLTVGLLGAMTLFLYGCLLEEKFVPDPSDPRLPKYTESGNQVGGALINDVAWKTDFSTSGMGGNRSFYFTNYSSGDSVTLTLDGMFTEGINRESPISFIVVLKNMSLQKLEDIKLFNGQTFILDGKVNYVIIEDGFSTIQDSIYYYYGGTGKVILKNVKTIKNTSFRRQNGEKYNPLIVAGTFEFNVDEISTAVTLGRFDFYINDDYLDQK